MSLMIGTIRPELLERGISANRPRHNEERIGIAKDFSLDFSGGIRVGIGIKKNNGRVFHGMVLEIEGREVLLHDGPEGIVEAENALRETGGHIFIAVAEDFHDIQGVRIQVNPIFFVMLRHVIEQFQVENQEPAAGVTEGADWGAFLEGFECPLAG